MSGESPAGLCYGAGRGHGDILRPDIQDHGWRDHAEREGDDEQRKESEEERFLGGKGS